MKLTRRDFLKLSGAAALSLSFPAVLEARAATVPVLLYHDISNATGDPLALSPSRFASQMEWLYETGYRAVSFADLFGLSSDEASRAVILTFDDGYASFLDYAYPLLAYYRFKATINIIGKHMGGYVSGNDPRVSWDECRYLAGTGLVEIGCHTFDLHKWYGRQPRSRAVTAMNEKLAEDLAHFQSFYQHEMGMPAQVLAWPYGMHDNRSIEIAKQKGFRYLLNSESRRFEMGRGYEEIPRLSIEAGAQLPLFREWIEKS